MRTRAHGTMPRDSKSQAHARASIARTATAATAPTVATSAGAESLRKSSQPARIVQDAWPSVSSLTAKPPRETIPLLSPARPFPLAARGCVSVGATEDSDDENECVVASLSRLSTLGRNGDRLAYPNLH